MRILLIVLSLLTVCFRVDGATSQDQENIFVRLETEAKRIPLYLSHFIIDNAGIDPGYCDRLERVLQFDMNYNGMTYIVPNTKEKERLAVARELEHTPLPSDWKDMGAFYLLKVKIENRKLSANLFAANTDSAKSVRDIALTGDIAQDRRLIHQLADNIHKALFGTDGIASTRILYTVKTGKGKDPVSEVWEADYDGENRRQLTNDSGYVVTPVYIPPKPGFTTGGFFFVSYKTGQPKIYYQQINQREPQRLSLLRGNQLMPTLSKQRDKIAFISDATGNPDLFMLEFSPDKGAIGKPYQIFATHQATQGTPTFSPDGKQLAFVSNKDGSPRVYVMNVPSPGTSLKDIKATLLTKVNKESSAPCWSPDGKKIAYCAVTQGVRQIWVYDFTTRQERQLTQGPGNKENPTWAPNSLHLIFNSSDADACDLYLVNLNQREAVKLTSGKGEKRFPCWEPR